MLSYTQEEARGWLQDHGWTGADKPWTGCRSDWFLLNADSGVKTALARNMVACLTDRSVGALLLVTETDIWPSAEYPYLFEVVRQHFGGMGTVDTHPGHLFGPGEMDQCRALVSLGLYFVWGFQLADDAGQWIIDVSHDEYMDVAAHDNTMLAQVMEYVEVGSRTEPT